VLCKTQGRGKGGLESVQPHLVKQNVRPPLAAITLTELLLETPLYRVQYPLSTNSCIEETGRKKGKRVSPQAFFIFFNILTVFETKILCTTYYAHAVESQAPKGPPVGLTTYPASYPFGVSVATSAVFVSCRIEVVVGGKVMALRRRKKTKTLGLDGSKEVEAATYDRITGNDCSPGNHRNCADAA